MSSGDIKLNFINRSGDTNNSNIVIFQKNVAEDMDELTVAWRVIKNCGRDDNHPFVYPMEFEVGAGDSDGNFTPRFPATNGDAYDMVKDTSGDVLIRSSKPATNRNEVEVRNTLDAGAISANIYRDGKLLAAKTNVSPAQKGVFEFHPRIYIGATSQATEGDVMSSAILQSKNTELTLFGITSADLVMTGGDSAPFEFHFENINAA